jgi:hypothetical protein
MADSTQKVGIQVEVNGVQKTFNSIKDLKDEIKNLQNVAESSDIGSEQYKQAVESLDVLNEKIKEVSQTQSQAKKATEELAKAEKEAVKETQDLRKQFEVLEDQLFLLAGQGKQNTKEFRDLTVEAAALNKKIDAVNSSLGENSAGRASAGFSQLKDGLQNLDFDSVKKGFSAIKTAMAATGIMLIVQLVGYLYENFDELSKGSGILARYLRVVGDVIGTIIEKGEQLLNFFTDTIGLTTEAGRAVEAQGKAFEDASAKSKEAIASQSSEYDRLINVAKASGKSTVDLEIAKQQAIIDTNKALLQQALTYLQNGGQLDEAKKKLINDELTAIKTASSQIEIIKSNEAKRIQDVNTKAYEKKKAEDEKLKNDNIAALKQLEDATIANETNEQTRAIAKANLDRKRRDEDINNLKVNQATKDALIIQSELTLANQLQAINDKKVADQKVIDDKIAADKLAQDEKNQAFLEAYYKKENDLATANIAKEKEAKRKAQAESLELTKTALEGAQSLSDAFFSIKMAKVKKGSAEEEALARKQFEINKAMNLGMAIINGVQSVLAITAVPDFTLGVATAIRIGAQVALSAASIAKIATTKFNSTGGGGTPSVGGGAGAGAPSIPAPPTISNKNANVDGTQFDENGRRIGSKNDNTINVVATVGVDEITAKTNRVNVLENQATF